MLHPLLTKTELREVPYKRAQLAYLLESIVNSDGRGATKEVGPTTRRLAERCLGGEWATGLRTQRKKAASDFGAHVAVSPTTELTRPTPPRRPASVRASRWSHQQCRGRPRAARWPT